MASLSGEFNLQEFTDLGQLGAGMRLYTYAPGTTTQKVAYTDQAGTIPHTYTSDGLGGVYIALNVRGELPAPLFLSSGGYDLTLKTSAGVTVWTRRAIGTEDASAAGVAAIREDLANQTDPAKGDALIAVHLTLTGGIDRTQHDKNEDGAALTIEDVGLTSAASPAVNSAKFENFAAAMTTRKRQVALIDQNLVFDANVLNRTRSNYKFVGKGSVANMYRKGVVSELFAPFVPPNDVNPRTQLQASSRTDTPVIVIMGDSIATEGPDTYAHTVSMWSVIKQREQTCNPEKTPVFYNRAIGGKTWLDANGTPTGSLPTWYNGALSWLDNVKTLNPDKLYLAFGMNDANGFNAGAVDAVVTKIKLWPKVPDIVFITNPVPALTTLFPDGTGFGFVDPVFQEGRDYAAGWVRTYAKAKGYGLIDINRMFVAARDGYDPVSSIMRLVETVSANSYTAAFSAQDFSFVGTASGAAWSEGRTLKVKCGLGSVDFIFITKTSGNFVVSGFTTTINTYKTVSTGVAVPAGSFELEVGVYGDIARVMIDSSGTGSGKTVIAEFQVIAHGGQHAPQIEWQDASGSGPFTSITYVAGFGDLKYPQIATDEDIWGVSDLTADIKSPFGGNGINHYTSKGVELIVRPVVEATDLRAPRAVMDSIDIVLGSGTTVWAGGGVVKAQRIGRVVHLTGNIKSTTTAGDGSTIFTVPAGYVPNTTNDIFTTSNNAGGVVQLQHTGGGVFKAPFGTISTLIALGGITYFVD